MPKGVAAAAGPFGERLRTSVTLSPRFKSRTAFGKALSISPNRLKTITTGETSPKLPELRKWAEELEVDERWLAFGGPVLEPKAQRRMVRNMLSQDLSLGDISRATALAEQRLQAVAAGDDPTLREFALLFGSWLTHVGLQVPSVRGDIEEMRQLARETRERAERRERSEVRYTALFRYLGETAATLSPDLLAWLQELAWPPGVTPTTESYVELVDGIRSQAGGVLRADLSPVERQWILGMEWPTAAIPAAAWYRAAERALLKARADEG